MITLQVLVLSYILISALMDLPGISNAYLAPFHVSLLLVNYTLAILSLLSTFQTDPGFLTADILESVKLGIGYVETLNASMTMEEESVDVQMTTEGNNGAV